MNRLLYKPAPKVLVVIAFAVVYLVWGSTYFFIRMAIQQIPALLMAFFRFFTAGALLFAWCWIRGEKMFVWESIRPALLSGFLLLFMGNGAVVWTEQYLPSSVVAVLTAASPIWFVVLDKANWAVNFRSRETVIGMMIGFVGVILLFSEKFSHALSSSGSHMEVVAMLVMMCGSMSWAGGSLYSKYKSRGPSHSVNTAWQMIGAGLVFLPASGLSGEWSHFHPGQITSQAWLALAYLISLGSLAGYSAYAWLLQVQPATRVSTHAYVNPVVAVLLGVWLAHEFLSGIQVAGLTIIIASVVLINLAKLRREKQSVSAANKRVPAISE